MVRVFRVTIPTATFVLLVSELLILTSCFLIAAYLVLEVDPSVFLLEDRGLFRILLVTATVMLGLHFVDLYSDFHHISRTGMVLEIAQATGFAFIAQALVAYADPGWITPRKLMMLGSFVAIAALCGWRVLFDSFFMRHVGVQRVLFVGTNPVILDIAEYLTRHPEVGWVNSGFLDDEAAPGAVLNGAPVLGRVRDIRRVARETQPGRIVVGLTERRDRMPVRELLDLRYSGIVIDEAGAAYEAACGRICTKELRPSQLIFSGELGPRRSTVALQTLYTIPLALVLIAVSLPVMLLAAVAVILTSRGPALFRQQRVGMGGKVFTLYKFRSMRAGAEARTGAVWATKDDPRVTPVGRWLRRLRIDELPQLWNVLRGDMSLVGPRPERPEFVRVLSEKIPYYPQRHSVKPGITGWAQINHKYGDTIEDTIVKLEFDLYYIKHMSLSLDLYIMFHTAKTVLRRKGAQ